MNNFNEDFQQALVENKGDIEKALELLVKNYVQDALNDFMKSELSAKLGYEKYEVQGKNSGDSRNGFYQRKLQTTVGELTLKIPRDRNNDFEPSPITKYKRDTDGIADIILKLYGTGLSDNEMKEIINSLIQSNYSKSKISTMTEALLEDVKKFKNRPIQSDYFAIYVDSTYVPLRRNTVQKEAINIVMGINNEGYREILGFSITPSESALEYEEILTNLKERGLKKALIFVSDGLPGINDVFMRLFPESKVQRCYIHLLRNLIKKVRSKDKLIISNEFMNIAKQIDKETAENVLNEFVKKRKDLYPKIEIWYEKIENMLTFYDFPPELRHLIYTNNIIESLNKQIKRCFKKTEQFVNEDSLEKRLVYMFQDYNLGNNHRKVRGWQKIIDLMN